MPVRPRLVYFDNNAIASLYEPGRQGRSPSLLAEWRTVLLHRVTVGAVAVVVSLYTIEEYAPVSRIDSQRYGTTLGFLRGPARARLMADTKRLLDREMERGRRLHEHELGLDQKTTDQLWRVFLVPAAIEEVSPETLKKKEKYLESTRHQMVTMTRAFEAAIKKEGYTGRPPSLARVINRWKRDGLQPTIDDLTTRTLKSIVSQHGLTPAWADLPPSAIPTLRNQVAFNLGRMVRNANGVKVLPSDIYDHDHYSSARYTDLLVTDDDEFRQTCALIEPSFRTMTFDEFFTTPCRPVVSL